MILHIQQQNRHQLGIVLKCTYLVSHPDVRYAECLNVVVYNIADSARISLLRFHGSSDYINACFINVSVLNVNGN